MFRSKTKRAGTGLLVLLAAMMFGCPAQGQDGKKVPISFLPPPLETATYSLGIYDAKSGKLVRRLQEAATTSAFTVGDNGLITSWDGNDDAGKAVPPGKYAARGYAVGALKVEGENILGNDWTNNDESMRITRVAGINLVPDSEALFVFATMADGGIRIIWFDEAGHEIKSVGRPMKAAGSLSGGKGGTQWKIESNVLNQYSPDGEKLRQLAAKPGEPNFVAVAASAINDRLYLLEDMPGWQRVRGLSWVETKQEDGKPVSIWQTFFERSIRPPDPTLGLEEPGTPVEVNLVENPLDPGKLQKIKLQAKTDDVGSYLVTADGLRLRRIGQRANLKAAKVVKGKTANSLAFYQSDGAAWDEFSIEGARNMMEFDAGEFEMIAAGEKMHTEKATEPPDL